MPSPDTWIQSDLLHLNPQHTGWTASSLEAHLRTVTAAPVTIKITNNRVSLISFKFQPNGSIAIRMRKEFLHAPGPIIQAIRNYAKNRRKNDWDTINHFAQTMLSETPSTPPGENTLQTKGTVHNLKTLYHQVNKRFYNNQLRTRITWARESTPRSLRSKSITFGTYCRDINLIRINPRLDRHDVPEEFIRYIIFHELLHAAVPSTYKNGRWTHHSATFRKLERQYPQYQTMQQIGKQLLTRI